MLKLKELTASICAPMSPFLGMLISGEAANVWLSAGIKLAGIIGTVASIWWMFRLNKLAQQHAVATMCADCIAGYTQQTDCEVPPERRPKKCPLHENSARANGR